MASTPAPRIRLPARAAPGEIIEVKTLIAHEMESGQRLEAGGRPVPRRIINRFTASFEGRVVFEAEWHPAIAANPYQSFFFRAERSGEFAFAWHDDNGTVYRASSRLSVG
ncbi:MAG: thiosulfate oxidation carrier complex protein SoxZ [Thalassobaculales bacterium]